MHDLGKVKKEANLLGKDQRPECSSKLLGTF